MCALFSIERDRERLQLLLRVATLYWIEGESQADIAVELGYSRPQISRLLAEARRRGVVSVNVHHPLERALELEAALTERFELASARVATHIDDNDAESTAPVAALAAETVLSMIRPDSVIGVTNGRAVSQVVAALPSTRYSEVTVVQAIGTIAHENHMVDSPELCQRMASVLGANYRILPAPLYLDNSRTAAILRRESSIGLTISMASHADILLTGIGATTKAGSGAIFDLWLSPEEIGELRKMGAVGHIGGHHIDVDGRHIDGELCRRILGVPFNRLRESSLVVAVAWGAQKVPAITGALRGGLVSHLVTDMRTAGGVRAVDNRLGEEGR